jgi:hypothetical protein
MARSSVPLRAWFAAIRLLLFQPKITAGKLGTTIGVRRRATAGRMKRAILTAMTAEDASAQLAGLDELYLTLS